ncbi:class II glutamine amidotransferase [Sorangium sp. So ce1335]|uniref:class II glutamine amidotransferase n=1 Tax=Sorangium sp. So ce1335 TaxID=3133335 RepID=UPI003F60B8B3
MPNLLAMSFEGELAPCFDLTCLRPGGRLPDGWGIGYYPGGEPSATVLKEPAPPQGSIRSELVKAWEHLESSLLVLHIRTATWGSINDANTQPFSRSWGGRDWLFAHSGSLVDRIEVDPKSLFQPVGSTDTELILCELLRWMASEDLRSIGDIDPAVLRDWFDEMNEHGPLTSVLSDGRDLVVYADRDREGDAFLWEVLPPYERLAFGDDDLEVDLTKRGVKSRKGVIVSSEELKVHAGAQPAHWARVPPGHLVILRQGALRATASPHIDRRRPSPSTPPMSSRPVRRPTHAAIRRFQVVHRTAYHYATAVERSTHLLRLTPAHDRLQTVLHNEINISVEGQQREYDDVFGNRARRVLLDTPFKELIIESRSRVELLDTDPLSFRPLRARSTIPLVWMPWQRQILQPFLLPPELAESELAELSEYAMTFVERNDYDLLDTLLDLNASIFEEYEYKQGATNVFTTAFDVYANRRGVCQDFTNLFICLTRLLGVPSRYVCGYIYTGPKHENQRQSEASHAWVQVYLPEIGWKGFDPTNGVLTQTEHIRVAVGRNYIDATPTSGTIYVGGGAERLEVDVRVDPID